MEAFAGTAGWLGGGLVLIALILGGWVYLLPFIVAQTRRASNVGAVFGVNLLFGWSVVGWIVALVMAIHSDTRPSGNSA
jgi:hypothetical protein